MKKPGHPFFALNGSEDFDLFFQEAGAGFSRSEQSVSAVDTWYMDTFDWRIFKSGRVCKRSGSRFQLAPLSEIMPVEEISGPEKERVFWWDFPPGRVRDRLESVLSVRALCPLFRVVGQIRSLHLYNRDDKTILRVFLHTGEIRTGDNESKTFSPYLHVAQVRGYPKPFHHVLELLEERGSWQPVEQDHFLQLALQLINRQPGDYTSKFAVSLHPEQTMNQVFSIIGLQLHHTMEQNLPGVLDDIDSEFLHDFRVAVRRTRSALSLLKKPLPPGQRRFFSQEFKWLGAVTGAVRDIDVCLKKEAVFREMLPQSKYRGLELLMEEIKRRRKRQLVTMQKNLHSKRTRDLLANWREFLLVLPDDIQRSAGQITCSKRARKIIGRCFRRLLHDAELIIEGDERDAAMHQIRIQGKKFRYLMEFFRSLFPEEATERLLKEMKGVQDDLGDFNDLSVQIDRFEKDLVAMSKKPQIRECLAGLIDALEAKKNRLRKRCLKRCKGFLDQEKKDLLDKILLNKTG